MQGRRVEGGWGALEQEGDYAPWYKDGELAGIWTILPGGTHGRCAAVGHGQGDEAEWTITEDEEGRVTVDPSIDAGEGDFHGHLVAGEWRG